MNDEEALGAIRYGDWVLVGELCGVSAQYAQKLSTRPGAKRYGEVMEALKKVVVQRQGLLQSIREWEAKAECDV